MKSCNFAIQAERKLLTNKLSSFDKYLVRQQPPFEIEEVCLFDALPENLTYPDITPQLFAWMKEMQF